MAEPTLNIPADGAKITIADGKLNVPNNPIIPFIEGDGTGADIWRASVRVFDAAVEKAYGGKRKIHWMEIYAGEKSNVQFGSWLPEATVQACRDYLVSIKGPLTTPIGKGIRSLNVALRQMLDLYVCLRPVRWFKGVPSPVRDPSAVGARVSCVPPRSLLFWLSPRPSSNYLFPLFVSLLHPAPPSAPPPSPRRC